MQAQPQSQPQIYAVHCHVCGRCIALCPQGVLAEDAGRIVAAHPERCDACLACEEACSEGAIEVSFAIVWAEPLADQPDRG